MELPVLSQFDNRTHPLFRGTTNLNTVNLGITTRCSMKCPNCSVAVPRELKSGKARDVLLSELYAVSRHMQGLQRIHITGGEPTLHKLFNHVVVSVKNWFAPEYLTIESNGFKFEEYAYVFDRYFNLVFITHYQKDAVYPGSPDNTNIIRDAQALLGDRLIVEPPVQHLTQLSGEKLFPGDVPCTKFYDPGLPSGWYDGKLYPCCVTFGIDRSAGIEVTANWREEILKLDMGCNRCVYRGT